jgi:hypothetical protein
MQCNEIRRNLPQFVAVHTRVAVGATRTLRVWVFYRVQDALRLLFNELNNNTLFTIKYQEKVCEQQRLHMLVKPECARRAHGLY